MERLFLTVLRMGMTTSYLILAVIIARFLLKKAPKNIICLLWIVVGLRLLCPFHIETSFSLLPEQTNSFASQVYNNVAVANEKYFYHNFISLYKPAKPCIFGLFGTFFDFCFFPKPTQISINLRRFPGKWCSNWCSK